MTHLPHDLAAVFPGDELLLRQLKAGDRHFQALADRFAALDAEVHGHDAGTLPAVSEAHLEDLKKQRLACLDDIAALVAGARRAA